MNTETLKIQQSSESKYLVPVNDYLSYIDVINYSSDTLYILVSNTYAQCSLLNHTLELPPLGSAHIDASGKHILGFWSGVRPSGYAEVEATYNDEVSNPGYPNSIGDIVGLQGALDSKSPTSHTHPLDDISNVDISNPLPDQALMYNGLEWVNSALPTQSGGDAATVVADHAAQANAHSISGVSGLQTALDSKAASNHNHTGIYDAAGTASASVASHAGQANAHGISGVNGLQTALDSKSPTSHSHTLDGLSDVTISSPQTNQVVKYNGTSWVNGDEAVSSGGTISVFSGSVLPVPSSVPGNGYIVNGRVRFSDGTTWVKLTPPVYEIPWMYVPLKTTLEPTVGNNVTTYTRTGTETFVDFEGISRTVEANEIPIEGARYVKNLLAQTETAVTSSLTVEAGTYIYSLQPCSGSVVFSGAASGTLTGSMDGAKQIILTTTAGTLTMTVSGTVGQAQLEKTTGQAKQVASEHISRGVEVAPYYHGTGVDGSKYFDTVNGNSIDGNGFIVYAEGGEIVSPIGAKIQGAASLTFTGNGSDWEGLGIGRDSNGNFCIVGVEYP